jgi:hypothetical protein
MVQRCLSVLLSVGVVLAMAFFATWAAAAYRSWP